MIVAVLMGSFLWRMAKHGHARTTSIILSGYETDNRFGNALP